MKLLLDTNAFIWWVGGNQRLSNKVIAVIEGPDREVFVSAASVWEIATKVRIGKLPEAAYLIGRFSKAISKQGFYELPVSILHADLAGSLPGKHRDPFDRMLAAQSKIEKMSIATNDGELKSFGVSAIW